MYVFVNLFFFTICTQVTIRSHSLIVELLEFLIHLLHFLLEFHINEAFDTDFLRLSDQLYGLSRVGSLLTTLA